MMELPLSVFDDTELALQARVLHHRLQKLPQGCRVFHRRRCCVAMNIFFARRIFSPPRHPCGMRRRRLGVAGAGSRACPARLLGALPPDASRFLLVARAERALGRVGEGGGGGGGGGGRGRVVALCPRPRHLFSFRAAVRGAGGCWALEGLSRQGGDVAIHNFEWRGLL